MEYQSPDVLQPTDTKSSTSIYGENQGVFHNDSRFILGDSNDQFHGKLVGGQSLLNKAKKAFFDWAENTAFHGIRYVFDRRASKLQRVIWFLLITGMWTALIWICISQYNRYFRYETVTQDTFRSETELAFPAVTICAQCLRYNIPGEEENNAILNRLIRVGSQEDFENLQGKYGSKIKDNATLLDFSESLRIPSDVFLYRCNWAQESINCSSYWTGVLDNFQCYTFNDDVSDEKIFTDTIGRDNGGLSMTVFLKQDLCVSKVYGSGILLSVHEAGVITDKSVSLNLAPGSYHSIGVTVNERHFLPPPVKAFGKSVCLDTERPDFVNPLKFFQRYSLSACEQECLMLYINETCECVSTRFPVNVRDSKVMSLDLSEQLELCGVVADRTCAVPAYRSFWDNYNHHMQRCGCLERCKYTKYTTTVSSSVLLPRMINAKPNITTWEQVLDMQFIKENFLTFEVYLDSKVVHVTKQVRDFTLGDLGASIGGFCGLAIGASVLTFFELFDMMITLIVRVLKSLGRLR